MATPKPSKRSLRLYALIDQLKDGKIHRAEDLAQVTGVSVRTISRDMETLAASGGAIEGERGTGYTTKAAITLPPLNLTETELEALHIALEVIGTGMEGEIRDAAASLSAKIDAVLPVDANAVHQQFGFAVYPFEEASRGFRYLETLRTAVRARQKLAITMQGARPTQVRPLKLAYWGRVWTLVIWDEIADRFAELRVDRITEVRVLPGLFVDEPGKRLEDHIARDV